MKIRPNDTSAADLAARAPAASRPGAVRPGKAAPAAPAPQAPADVEEVPVQVSPTARLLASREGGLDGADALPVDAARVAQVQRALADGTYEIDEEALARAIVQKELRWTPGAK